MSNRFSSIQLYELKSSIQAYHTEIEPHIIPILNELGIKSDTPFWLPKFINLLCRPGRNSGKLQSNSKKVREILSLLEGLVAEKSGASYFTSAILNGIVLLKTVYSRQGSINAPKKIFLMPNVSVAITLRKLAQLARSMTAKQFSQQIKLLYAKDLKSKMMFFKNEQHRLAKLGTE